MDVYTPYLAAIAIGWLLSHAVKYIIATVRGKKVDLTRQLFISGGMPSSHTATVVALWAVVLFKDGWTSGLFGLATLVVLIVGYDAVKVRRSVGEHGEVIAQLIKKTKADIPVPHTAKGHRGTEVVAGALLGFAVGAAVYLISSSWSW